MDVGRRPTATELAMIDQMLGLKFRRINSNKIRELITMNESGATMASKLRVTFRRSVKQGVNCKSHSTTEM